jgi:hypothetical protein
MRSLGFNRARGLAPSAPVLESSSRRRISRLEGGLYVAVFGLWLAIGLEALSLIPETLKRKTPLISERGQTSLEDGQ